MADQRMLEQVSLRQVSAHLHHSVPFTLPSMQEMVADPAWFLWARRGASLSASKDNISVQKQQKYGCPNQFISPWNHFHDQTPSAFSLPAWKGTAKDAVSLAGESLQNKGNQTQKVTKVCPYVIPSMTSMDTFDQPKQESWKALWSQGQGVKTPRPRCWLWPSGANLGISKAELFGYPTPASFHSAEQWPWWLHHTVLVSRIYKLMELSSTHWFSCKCTMLPSALLESRLHLYAHLQASVPMQSWLISKLSVTASYWP